MVPAQQVDLHEYPREHHKDVGYGEAALADEGHQGQDDQQNRRNTCNDAFNEARRGAINPTLRSRVVWPYR